MTYKLVPGYGLQGKLDTKAAVKMYIVYYLFLKFVGCNIHMQRAQSKPVTR